MRSKGFPELDLSRVRTVSVRERGSKVRAEQLAGPLRPGMGLRQLMEAMPDLLKARELRAVARAAVRARRAGQPVIAMLGGHVVKSGCGPVLADLAAQGFITHVAANGAVAVHEVELALFGQTSEDVAAGLRDGSFGMARETAETVNQAAARAAAQGIGFGQALGERLRELDGAWVEQSVIARCSALGIPCTIHVALGTDIVHQHPSADGASIGLASLRDFRILGASVAGLTERGLVLNLGSAVLMPEVFLKALSAARNLGHPARGFATANFDMVQHYRPQANLLTRPVADGGTGYALSGHHEIMLPLLAACILDEAAEEGS